MNGVSAASGKLGAVVGAYMFGAIASVTSYPTVMAICCGLSLFGALITHYYIADNLDLQTGPADTPLLAEHIDEKAQERVR